MHTLKTEYPELAAMFQALQDGIVDPQGGDAYGPASHWDIWALGTQLTNEAEEPGYDHMPRIAKGLRIVAEAIDPAPYVHEHRYSCFDIYGKLNGSCA